MSRSRYSANQRIMAVEDYLSGRKNMQQICSDLGILSRETVRRWILLYQSQGSRAFDASKKIKVILKNLKLRLLKNTLLESDRSQILLQNIVFQELIPYNNGF